jgi:uncharacterized membrane protein YqhA
MNKVEATLEHWVFRSRWLLAPFFVGLLLAIVALLIKFVKQLAVLATGMLTLSDSEMIVQVLTLVDSALIAALLLIIGFSGYENFVSKTPRASTRTGGLDGPRGLCRFEDPARGRHRSGVLFAVTDRITESKGGH